MKKISLPPIDVVLFGILLMIHLIGTEARCQQPVAGKARYQISATPSGTMPSNAAFPDGRYMVTWVQGGDIYYRVLDYKGDFSGGQIRLDYGGSESNPVVAADPSGDYLIAFLSTLTDNRKDVYGTMFTYNGIPMPGWEASKRIDDDQPLDGFDEWLQIAGFSSVGPKFLVTWGDDDEGQQTYTLENAWTKVVTSAYVGHSTIRVDEAQADTASNSPTGAVDGRDQLLLTWFDARTESLQNQSSLYFKRLDQNGAVLTPETRLLERLQVDTPALAVNTTQTAEQDEYVIAWPYSVTDSQTQLVEWRLVYQRFSSTDEAIGSEIRVDQDGTYQYKTRPDVSINELGDVLIVWQDFRSGIDGDIYARVFDKSGSPLLDEFRVDIEDGSHPVSAFPGLSTFHDKFLVTWEESTQGGSEDVYGSLYTFDGIGPAIDTTSTYPGGPVLYDTLSTYVLPIQVLIRDDSARINSGLDNASVTWTRICPRPPAVNGTGPLQKIAGTDSFYFDLPEIESPGTEIRYHINAVDSALNDRQVPDDERQLFVADLGDINLNSLIDPYDVALVEDYVCRSGVLEEYELTFADYDQNSLWNCDDVDSLRKYAVASFDPDTLPSCLPDNGWSITRYPLELGVGGAPAGMSDTISVYLDNDSSFVKGVHIELGYDGTYFTIVDTTTTPRTAGYGVTPLCCGEPPDSSFALAGIPTPEFDRYNLYGPDSIPPGSGSILDFEISVDDSTPPGYYHFYLTRDVLYGPDHKPIYTMPLRGKFFVPAPPPVSIVTTPVADTLLSPGDTLTFNTTLTNHSESTKSPKFFVYGTTTGPDSFSFLAVDTTQIMVLPPGGRKRDITDLEVPAGAPAGHYIFTTYVSDDSVVMDEDPFGFRVNGQSKPGSGGDRLLSSGGQMKPWRVLNGWFGYNERHAEGGKEGARASEIPRSFSVTQNYPNPFNPSTTISYDIPGGASSVPVRIRIYDLRGRLVRTLLDEERAPGRYRVHWDGWDDRGREVASGVYLYRLQAGAFVSTRKMVIAR